MRVACGPFLYFVSAHAASCISNSPLNSMAGASAKLYRAANIHGCREEVFPLR
jgi:hypothetical protein